MRQQKATSPEGTKFRLCDAGSLFDLFRRLGSFQSFPRLNPTLPAFCQPSLSKASKGIKSYHPLQEWSGATSLRPLPDPKGGRGGAQQTDRRSIGARLCRRPAAATSDLAKDERITGYLPPVKFQNQWGSGGA